MNIFIKFLMLLCFKNQEAAGLRSEKIIYFVTSTLGISEVILNSAYLIGALLINKYTKFKLRKHYVLYLLFFVIMNVSFHMMKNKILNTERSK